MGCCGLVGGTFLPSGSPPGLHQWVGVSLIGQPEGNQFYQGRTSCCLELGGPPTVALDVVPPRGMLSTGSGEVNHLLGLGECSGAGTGGTAEADGCLAGEAPCDKENG